MRRWTGMLAAVAASMAAKRSGVCADHLSVEAGASAGALPGRRRGRHSWRARWASRWQDVGPAGRGRQPAGRRRGHRVGGARPVAARRLHADPGGERPSGEPVPLSQPALRPVPGFHRHRLRLLPNVVLACEDSPRRNWRRCLRSRGKRRDNCPTAYAGVGTSGHLAGELLKYMTKVDITPVPYKGGAPVLNDLLAGTFRCRSTTFRN